jgi:hypothetical protein
MDKRIEKNLDKKLRKVEQRRTEFLVKRSDVLSTIDELNQYLNGNVTNSGLIQSLEELKSKLEYEKR